MRKRSRKTQVKHTDTWFSKYVRLRDADKNGMCACITCGKKKPWKEMDCGHFIRRGCTELRWDEMNAHAQCQGCNKYRDGMEAVHGHEVINRYGLEEHTRLVKVRKAMKPYYIGLPKLRELEEQFKAQAKEVAKLKGVTL